jgi:hypothetical protein
VEVAPVHILNKQQATSVRFADFDIADETKRSAPDPCPSASTPVALYSCSAVHCSLPRVPHMFCSFHQHGRPLPLHSLFAPAAT